MDVAIGMEVAGDDDRYCRRQSGSLASGQPSQFVANQSSRHGTQITQQ